MSPPIRDGSGSSIGSIRLGDGSEISEVRTGAGDVLFSGIGSAIPGSARPASGVSRLTFDDADTSNSTALDVWGSNNGSINGATTGMSGANDTYTTNEAYSFDGTDDNVTLGSDVFSLPTGSVAAWIYIDSVTGSRPVSFEGVCDIRVDPGQSGDLDVSTFDGSSHNVVLDSSPSTGTWLHVCLTFDGSTLTGYLDGSSQGNTSSGSPIFGNLTRGNAIGSKFDGTDHFAGDIDDVRVYDKALTSTEVSDLYDNGAI